MESAFIHDLEAPTMKRSLASSGASTVLGLGRRSDYPSMHAHAVIQELGRNQSGIVALQQMGTRGGAGTRTGEGPIGREGLSD